MIDNNRVKYSPCVFFIWTGDHGALLRRSGHLFLLVPFRGTHPRADLVGKSREHFHSRGTLHVARRRSGALDASWTRLNPE
jgi:hypothetical protein